MTIRSYSHMMNFQATINKEDGPILGNRFMFMLGGMPNVLGGGGPNNRKPQEKYSIRGNLQLRSMRYLCDAIDVPGLTLNTDERPGYSPSAATHMPGRIEYGQLSATFICRDWMSEKEYFDDWIFSIKNSHGQSGPGATFDTAYMVDYVVDANIIVLSAYNTPGDTSDPIEYSAIRYAIVVRNLYPISIEPLNMNWADEHPLKVQVNFQYAYYEPIIKMAQFANRDPLVSHVQEPARRVADLNIKPASGGVTTPNSTTNPFIK